MCSDRRGQADGSGVALRKAFDDGARAPLPDDMNELLRKLDEGDRDAVAEAPKAT